MDIKLKFDRPANKSGKYGTEDILRVAKVHDTFRNMSGAVIPDNINKTGVEPERIMQGVAIKETGLKQSKRGYAYNFDDTKAQAAYKARHMAEGARVADVQQLKDATTEVARPGELYKYNMPQVTEAVKQHDKAEKGKNRDVAAGMSAMQEKMKNAKSVEEGLDKWRGRGKEPAYAGDAIAIGKAIKEQY